MRRAPRRRSTALLAPLVLTAGCAALSDDVRVPPAPPVQTYQEARLPGYDPRIRVFADETRVQPEIEANWRRIRAAWIAAGRPARIDVSMLVLSGGAADGAFGVGLLNGWSVAGDRPEFRVVTGVSTGALIAPYAFLGSAFDDAMRESFLSTTSTADLFELAPFRLLRGALAIADSTPLQRRIEAAITPEMVAAIAKEGRRGRKLLIGTTNLDARRAVVWDLTMIAASDQPDRERLIERVLLASASIPGVAPPVRIRVEAGGETYEEFHVDGGVTNTLIYAAAPIRLSNPFADELPAQLTVYLIQNNKVRKSYAPVRNSLPAVVGESISEMIRSQARGDQIRVFALAQRDGVAFRLAVVPQDFEFETDDEFDAGYLRALYQLGYSLSVGGYPWRTTPPGFESRERLSRVGQGR